MSQLHELLCTLTHQQRAAIELVHLSLDCYNSAEGAGLLSGVERYAALTGRVEICAVQANTLPMFWSLLLRRMRWPVPPRHTDERVLATISATDGRGVLRVLATETASVITLARMAHGEGKAERKAARAADAKALATDPVTGEIFE